MELRLTLEDGVISRAVEEAATKTVRALVGDQFESSYKGKGEGLVAVEEAVRSAVMGLDLRTMVNTAILERLPLVVRERVDKAVAREVDAELKRRQVAVAHPPGLIP